MSDQAIRPGFAWSCEIEFSGEAFPENAQFRSQFRASMNSPVLLDLTNQIHRVNATTLRIDLTAAQTAGLSIGEVFFDIVRVDLASPAHLRAIFAASVRPSVTRL
jgi:hypothetical protein